MESGSSGEVPQQMLRRVQGVSPNGDATAQSLPRESPVKMRGSPTSPMLDYVKRTQMEAQERRTATRISALIDDEKGLDRVNLQMRVSPAMNVARSPEDLARTSGSPSRQSMIGPSSPSIASASGVRRNITQRRSRDKVRDNGASAPFSGLLTRRPRSRSQDRRYSLESRRGLEECERQDWRATSARFLPRTAEKKPTLEERGRTVHLSPYLFIESEDEGKDETGDDQEVRTNTQTGLAYRVPSSTRPGESDSESSSSDSLPVTYLDPTTPFLRSNIPPEDKYPILHKHMTDLWYARQEAIRGLGDALANDDDGLFGILQSKVEEFNKALHSSLRGLKEVQAFYHHPEVSPSPKSSPSSQPKFCPVDDLPLGASGGLKRSCKDNSVEDRGAFRIFFSYQGVESHRYVNDAMATRMLFAMARSYLENDFNFRLTGDTELDLIHEGAKLTRVGYLANVPVLENAILVILYPRSDSFCDSGNPSSPVPSSPVPRALPSPDRNRLEVAVEDVDEFGPRGTLQSPSLDSRSYDKIRQSFKCPRFSGQAREWKQWDKGFVRYLSIWDLDYVIDPEFYDVLPLSAAQRRDNKLVYFIIEDAVQGSPLASSYIKPVAMHNGFEAYYTLHDGYVFAGSTTSTLLLNELSNFRFRANETPTELCLRLEELFQELKLIPGDAAVVFNDTQQIGYLINALRHEKEWEFVCSSITSAQIKGGMTFRQACDELRVRCEQIRANELLDKPVKGKKVKGFVAQTSGEESVVEQTSEKIFSLISTMAKRHNAGETSPAAEGTASPGDTPGTSRRKRGGKKFPLHECLAAGCAEETTYPLCPLHYHSLVSAKTQSLPLRNNYGNATFDTKSSLIVYPPKTPTDRLPKVPTLAALPQ